MEPTDVCAICEEKRERTPVTVSCGCPPLCCGEPPAYVTTGSDGVAYACRKCGRSIIISRTDAGEVCVPDVKGAVEALEAFCRAGCIGDGCDGQGCCGVYGALRSLRGEDAAT